MRGKIERVILVLGLVMILAGVLFQPGAASAAGDISAADQAPTSPAAPGDPEDLETFLDELLAAEMADNHIPGAMVAVW